MLTTSPRKSSVEGQAGVAYFLGPLSLAQLVLSPGDKIPADWLAMLGMAFVRIADAPKAREWWWVSVVHLRHIEGAPVHKEGDVTHELMICSIDPECPIAAILGLEPKPVLQPMGLVIGKSKTVIQFDAENDGIARNLLAVCTKMAVDGAAPLDGFERGWRGMIDAVLPKLHSQAREADERFN